MAATWPSSNQTVPRALDVLGYSPEERDIIIAYIDEHKTIVGAPALKAEPCDLCLLDGR